MSADRDIDLLLVDALKLQVLERSRQVWIQTALDLDAELEMERSKVRALQATVQELQTTVLGMGKRSPLALVPASEVLQ